MKKFFGIIICMLMITAALSTVTATTIFPVSADSTPPEWRNQGQSASTISVGDSNVLYAEGKDNTALDYAYLSTNETGVWQDFTGLIDYDYVRTITIDHTLVDEDLLNFPVLVSITDSQFTSHVQADGDDFVFYDATNTTKLSHEIEIYNSGTGKLVAWVNVPQVSSSIDTVFYLYYGNPDVPDQQDVEGTWNDNYVFVQHMTGSSYTELDDSTANNFDITGQSGSPGFNAAGKVGNSVSFNGNADLQASGFTLHDNSYTVSAWVLPDYLYYDNYVVSGNGQGNADVGNPCLSIEEYYDYIFQAQVLSKSSVPYKAEYDSRTADDVWTYMTGRADLSTSKVHIFVDGESKSSGAITTIKAATNGINIGSSAGRNDKITGNIDEVRVADTAFSDGWIKTEYNSMADSSFITVGPEEAADAVGDTVYDSPMLLEDNDQWQWSNFTWQNADISEGTIVGWTITYVDANGNSVTTDVESFDIQINNAPYTPGSPDPADEATDVDPETDLSWTGGDPDAGDSVTYTVCFDTTTPPEEVGTTTETTYDPGILDNTTTYYWKIISEDSFGKITEGPIWEFTTINNPPKEPSNPDPENQSTGIVINKDISWTGGDPDPTDTILYDVYFGTDSNPPLVAEDISGETYEQGTMEFNTTYYWKIVAEDSKGLITEGDVWEFTTKPENDPPFVPSAPNPANGTDDVGKDLDEVSWTGGDPNQGDIVTYDVYFGTDSNPPLVAEDLSLTKYTFEDTLDYNTTYYWKIVSEDDKGLTTEGPVWQFTTEIAVPNLAITEIAGGLGLKITVENSGDGDAIGATGSILFRGSGFIIPGGGEIEIPATDIPAQESIVLDPFVFGIGINMNLNVDIGVAGSSAEKSEKVFVIGPFVMVQ